MWSREFHDFFGQVSRRLPAAQGVCYAVACASVSRKGGWACADFCRALSLFSAVRGVQGVVSILRFCVSDASFYGV